MLKYIYVGCFGQMGCTEIYNKSSAVADLGNRGHNRHGPKRGEQMCPFCGELGPCLKQCGLAEVYFRTKWRLHLSSRLATIDMNRKRGLCPF